MDREDLMYVFGVLLVAAGAGLSLNPGAGLVCAGFGVLIPFFRTKKGPVK